MTNLYEEDETLWKETQARMIEEGRLDELDYNSLLTLLLEMTRSDKNSVIGLARIVILHLLKLKFQPEKRSRSWLASVDANRASLNTLLDSKTLRNYLTASLSKIYTMAKRGAHIETGLPLSTFPDECPFTIEQILDESFFA